MAGPHRKENRRKNTMDYIRLTPEYDAAAAELIRTNLKKLHLDIPGTAYFDPELDHLSDYYAKPGRGYYVLIDNGTVIGGIGLAECSGFRNCCELQKLYLADSEKGKGLGYGLVSFIEDKAREKGYRRIYLETHSSLQAAIHIYEKAGYQRIDRPVSIVHGAMDRFYLKELFS